MNWLSKLFGPFGLIWDTLLFPQSVSDGTIPKGATPLYIPPVTSKVSNSQKVPDPVEPEYFLASALVAFVLIIGY